MKTAADYLDAIRDRYNLKSDSAAAAMLGLTRSSISRFRLGEDSFSEPTALRVAELLDLDPVEIAIASLAQRAKAPESRALWERALARLAPAARHTPPSSGSSTVCIM